MKIQRSFKIALNIILHSKIRSWLTIIGIIIGIAAVVSIVSLGQGAQQSLEKNLQSLNADILTITPGFSRAHGAEAGFHGPEGGSPSTASTTTTAKNLSTRDVIALKSIPNIIKVTGIVSGSVDSVSFLGKTAKASVQGVDPAVWKDISTAELSSGRSLTQGDTNVVVVGSRVANSTFSGLEINRQMTINGKVFRVVGILKESGAGDDSKIIMPIDDAVTIIEGKDLKSFDTILIKIQDIALTDETVTKINDKLLLSHGIFKAQKQDFSVSSPKSMQERVTSAISSVTLFLTAIAVISLIVGTIGVMNTMFTSVLEKTKEIGILKALGAKNRDILAIFLLNSAIIGIIGGIFGIILGLITSNYFSALSGSSTASMGKFSLGSAYVSPSLIIGVFLLSLFVGLIAGAIPAYRASKLKPVDALRYE